MDEANFEIINGTQLEDQEIVTGDAEKVSIEDEPDETSLSPSFSSLPPSIEHVNGELIINDAIVEDIGDADDADDTLAEHEKITRWRTQSVKLLNEKDEEEAKQMAELLEQAKRELKEWYDQYYDQLNRLKNSNREAEANWVAERDSDKPGKEWGKVAELCDLNQKNTKDTLRMKSILLKVKQNPPIESTP